MPRPTLVIFNPRAAGGRAARRWPLLEGLVRAQLGDLEVEPTRCARDAERIAREAVRAGVEQIVVAGGDGTLSEVASGILAADLGRRVALGVLPMGSGCDFARSLGLPRDPRAAALWLRPDERRRVDAGRLRYTDVHDRTHTSYFMNVASFGLSGATDEFVERMNKRLGPSLSFALGALAAIATYRPPRVSLELDGRTAYEGEVALVAAANGCSFGSGMRIAPEARLDDGLLDVILIEATSKLRLAGRMPALYNGSHLRYEEAHRERARRIAARALSGSAVLDVDGEVLGGLPIEIEIMPKAIELFGAHEQPSLLA